MNNEDYVEDYIVCQLWFYFPQTYRPLPFFVHDKKVLCIYDIALPVHIKYLTIPIVDHLFHKYLDSP